VLLLVGLLTAPEINDRLTIDVDREGHSHFGTRGQDLYAMSHRDERREFGDRQAGRCRTRIRP
jgi:hypothetical protein